MRSAQFGAPGGKDFPGDTWRTRAHRLRCLPPWRLDLQPGTLAAPLAEVKPSMPLDPRLRSALLDLFEYRMVHLESPMDGLRLLDLIGGHGELRSSQTHWTLTYEPPSDDAQAQGEAESGLTLPH